MDLDDLEQELDRTLRLIASAHDRVLVTELRAYAAELQSRIERIKAIDAVMAPRIPLG